MRRTGRREVRHVRDEIQILNATTIGEIDAALPPLSASAQMPSSSPEMHSSPAALCNLPL
jgi:hypothetical protein